MSLYVGIVCYRIEYLYHDHCISNDFYQDGIQWIMISIVEWFRFVEYFHLVGMIDICDARKIGCVMNMIWEYFVFWIDYFVGITLSILMIDQVVYLWNEFYLFIYYSTSFYFYGILLYHSLIRNRIVTSIFAFLFLMDCCHKILYHHYYSITITISILHHHSYQLDNHDYPFQYIFIRWKSIWYLSIGCIFTFTIINDSQIHTWFQFSNPFRFTIIHFNHKYHWLHPFISYHTYIITCRFQYDHHPFISNTLFILHNKINHLNRLEESK